MRITTQPWPVLERDARGQQAYPLICHVAGMFLVEIDSDNTAGPYYWQCSSIPHEWPGCAHIDTPCFMTYDLPDGRSWRIIASHSQYPREEKYTLADWRFYLDGSIDKHIEAPHTLLGRYAETVINALATPTQDLVFPDSTPVVLDAAYGLQSFHVPLHDTVFRVLEYPPLEFDDGTPRARHGAVIRDDLSSRWQAHLVWGIPGKPPRLWPHGAHPLTEQPETENPLLDALAETLAAHDTHASRW